MKKKFVSVLVTSMLLVCTTGCASDNSASQTGENSMTTQEKNTADAVSRTDDLAEILQDDTKGKLEECFALLGKADADAAELLGGGKENLESDGVTKVSRSYSVKLFGEETEVEGLYDENDCVYMITMNLQKPDASVYSEQLKALYGEPEWTDTLSEEGSLWESWSIGDVQLRLYQEYGVVSLEIIEASEMDDTDNFDTGSLFTGWLPQGIEQVMSETKPNELLRQTIIDYYEIPEEFWEQTRYYYNYVDLNGDGTDEIFAVVVGSYTSGTGGDSALWCQESEGKMQIYQAFTLVNTPVIVTEKAVESKEQGTKALIMQRWGEEEPEIIQLTCTNGVYTNVSDAQILEKLDGIKGRAIICNNLIEDMENGDCLTLAQ